MISVESVLTISIRVRVSSKRTYKAQMKGMLDLNQRQIVLQTIALPLSKYFFKRKNCCMCLYYIFLMCQLTQTALQLVDNTSIANGITTLEQRDSIFQIHNFNIHWNYLFLYLVYIL